jgi:hypothetical protein
MSAAQVSRVQTLTLPRGNCEETYRDNTRKNYYDPPKPIKFNTISKLFYDIIIIIIIVIIIMVIIIIMIIINMIIFIIITSQ